MEFADDDNEYLDAAARLLNSFEITDDTPFDRLLLLAIYSLQTRDSVKMAELLRKVNTMAVDVSGLQTAAAAAAALLQQLAADDDSAQVQTEVDAITQQLNDAVAANTPAPAPEPAPAP